MKGLFLGFLFTTSALANTLEVSYFGKDILFLKKGKNGQYRELKNTRVRRPKLDVVITNQKGQKDKYKVKLDSSELRKVGHHLSISGAGKTKSLRLGNKLIKANLDKFHKIGLKTKKSIKLVKTDLKKDLVHLIKGIDQNIDLNRLQVDISRSTLTCTSLKSVNVTCLMQTRAKASFKALDKGPMNRLAIHLNDLRKEMTGSLGLDYDIDGYREFLNKTENLISQALDGKKRSKRFSTQKLIGLKQMIIDERIDSYEYSAIRSKSVLNFVNKVIQKLNS